MNETKNWRLKNEPITEEAKKWLEHINDHKLLHLFSDGLLEWSLSVSQHTKTLIVTVLIPPIHFDDENAIRDKTKEIITEHNYFSHVQVHYDIHFQEEWSK